MKPKIQGQTLFCHHHAPRLEDVKLYFSEKGAPEVEAEQFFHVYEQRHWKNEKGFFYKSWRVIAFRWIFSILKQHPKAA